MSTRQIIWRSPYTKSSEVVIGPNTKGTLFDERTTTHQMDKHFEVPFFTFKLTALHDKAVLDPQPDVLDHLIVISGLNTNQNERLGELLLVRTGKGIYRWTPPKPFLMQRGDAFQIQIDTRDFATVPLHNNGESRKAIHQIRVEMKLEGELFVYAPHISANGTTEIPLST
jgi:hypothetical protein